MMFILKAEFLKFFYDIKRYKFNYTMGLVSTFIMIAGLYWGISVFSPTGKNATSFLGLILWLFASTCISDASDHLFEERYYGTIEQLSIVRFSLLNIFIARFFIVFLFSLGEMVVVSIPIFVLFSPKISYFFVGWENLLISLSLIVIIVITLYGVGLLLAALGLIFKRVAAFSGILEYLILFFSGIIVPYDEMPMGLKFLTDILPMGLAIRALRGLEYGQILWKEIFLAGLYCVTVFSLAVMIFRKGIRYVKKTGEYSAY